MRYLRTPTDIWTSLSTEFNFSVDACASDANHLLPRYWTEQDDGLAQDWTGEVVYCHPMFDLNVGKWVAKAARSRCTTVMLIPAATHTRYFHRYIYHNPRCEIRFLEKPKRGFRFGADDGTEDDPDRLGYIRALMIVVFRNNSSNSLPGPIAHGETPTVHHRFVTISQLGATFGVGHAVMKRRLVEVGLCHDAHTPTAAAVRKGLCRVLPACHQKPLVLWHMEQTCATLRDAGPWIQKPEPVRTVVCGNSSHMTASSGTDEQRENEK